MALHSPRWPGTHFVAEDDLSADTELLNSLHFTSWVVGMYVCGPTAQLVHSFILIAYKYISLTVQLIGVPTD